MRFFVVQCNSFQILINFSLVFKITSKVGVRPIPFQHKLQLLVSHFFWRQLCDVICNLPIYRNPANARNLLNFFNQLYINLFVLMHLLTHRKNAILIRNTFKQY